MQTVDGLDVQDELHAIQVAVTGIQAAQEALIPLMPEVIKRVVPFIADHVCHDEQTRNNTANALMILMGMNGYTATMHD